MIMQLAVGASPPGQLLDTIVYWVGFTPPRVGKNPESWAVPVLVIVTGCAAEVVPTVTFGKFRLVGESVSTAAVGAVPVPLSEIKKDCAGPPPLLEADRPT